MYTEVDNESQHYTRRFDMRPILHKFIAGVFKTLLCGKKLEETELNELLDCLPVQSSSKGQYQTVFDLLEAVCILISMVNSVSFCSIIYKGDKPTYLSCVAIR